MAAIGNCTAQAFGHLAYNMFNYLFSWGDTYWCHWRKTKYFLFTPRPVSSRLIHHWGEITRTGQLKPYTAMRCVCGLSCACAVLRVRVSLTMNVFAQTCATAMWAARSACS